MSDIWDNLLYRNFDFHNQSNRSYKNSINSYFWTFYLRKNQSSPGDVWSFVIERPIFSDNPKAHFALFTRFSCTFIWKVALFMKSTWKCAFHVKSAWKATKTADSTQISHFDLVFHRVQREGQLGIYLNFLVVFGGAHMCLVMHVVHMCACGACMCIWYIYAHMCVWWCMYVYMLYMYATVIGDACGAHVFHVLFTFQVFFMKSITFHMKSTTFHARKTTCKEM